MVVDNGPASEALFDPSKHDQQLVYILACHNAREWVSAGTELSLVPCIRWNALADGDTKRAPDSPVERADLCQHKAFNLIQLHTGEECQGEHQGSWRSNVHDSNASGYTESMTRRTA